MKKILFFTCVAVLCVSGVVRAQQKDAAFFKNLVYKNAASIGVDRTNLENIRVSDAYFDNTSGTYVVYLQNTYKGVDIFNEISSVSFRDDNLAVSSYYPFKNKELLQETLKAHPSISATDALLKAASALNLTPKQSLVPLRRELENRFYEFDNLGIAQNNITAKLLWLPDETNKSLHLTWQVNIHSLEKNALWLINVDAITGSVLSKQNLTVYETMQVPQNRPRNVYVYENREIEESNNFSTKSEASPSSVNSASFNVIPYPFESPLKSNPVLETDPWTRSFNTKAYTNKWNSDATTDYTITKGNNVYVQDDHDKKDGTNGASPESLTNLPNLNFNYSPNYNFDPVLDTPTANFGLTNLFYWNNLMHDMSYQYGFDEPAGNFQATNFNRGGKEKDYLIADGQDLTDVDNANFATPSDGGSPRMQMYMWKGSILKFLHINASPLNFNGDKLAQEGAVSNNNLIADIGTITADLAIYQDPVYPDSSTGCKPAANAASLVGKIVYIDRGSCSFVDKFKNAQKAGAKGIIVGNVAPNDPRYIPAPGANDARGNRLVTMSATPKDNSITIPGFFVMYDTALKIKSNIKAGVVNATLTNPPSLDGELDNTIHPHEYAHGISTRLVGGPQNVSCLNSLTDAEQPGEGWSDYYALMMTENWATVSPVFGGLLARPIGVYAFQGYDYTSRGIRLYSYSTDFEVNPWTYDRLRTDTSFKEYNPISNPGAIYYTGEFWCTALWEVTWELIKSYGISANIFDATGTGGNIIALKLVTEGMKYTKCSPGCVNARDGILKADTVLFGAKYSPELWRAFARRGLGVNADQGSILKIKDAQGDYSTPQNLPVTWGTFTAQKQGNTAQLKWTTVQEFNTDKFVVERSSDGRSYTQVGSIKAAGNSNTVSSYSYSDIHPMRGNNVYRIKQVDKDGKFSFSDLRNLNFADIKPYISVSPNPTKDVVTINIPGNAETLTLQLIGNNGQQLATYTMGGEIYSFNVSSLANGIYNIVITAKDYTAKYKLVVQ